MTNQTNYFPCRESIDLTNDSDSSNESSSDNSVSDSDSDSSIPGDPDEYYGGYGYCFNCGKLPLISVFEKFREIENFQIQVVVAIGVLDVHTCDTLCIFCDEEEE